MSDSGSEDYSSSEDEDYVPSGEEYSEDDVNDLVNEDGTDGDDDDDAPQPQMCKKKNTKGVLSRKRKKGVLTLGSGDADRQDESHIDDDECGAPDFKQEKVDKVEEEKKKADDLWASFLSDVGQKPKAAIPASTQKEQSDVTSKVGLEPQGLGVKKFSQELQGQEKAKDNAKIRITKVFDFAGEEVRVTKEVEATSKEAKTYLKQQDSPEKTLSPSSNPVAPPSSSGVQRLGGMNSVLGKLGSKKQKMSTLEKSKLDWETFKEQEGIGDELAIHNRGKEGYIERKAFLERVDHRQFELERDIRLKNMKQ